jgi:hypothetical protein
VSGLPAQAASQPKEPDPATFQPITKKVGDTTWLQKMDPKSGRFFYVNTANKKSQWVEPEGWNPNIDARPTKPATASISQANSAELAKKKFQMSRIQAGERKGQHAAADGASASGSGGGGSGGTCTAQPAAVEPTAADQKVIEGVAWVCKLDPNSKKHYYVRYM